ncbi:peptidase S8/S53 domain-containing protein [Zychaea mexicana]|uniref:peptidase S8/S53 domain-containing protein n=1 Tax=Zychaea mexicana TaxID=64656 RepID=UPI0022FE368B|nr:peptidase S8/S53 domain-containing protein [Zychaea mexicana]KAI9498438.1 peptidase S8/S53 domain-containing protein [Zychaea mexicana]
MHTAPSIPLPFDAVVAKYVLLLPLLLSVLLSIISPSSIHALPQQQQSSSSSSSSSSATVASLSSSDSSNDDRYIVVLKPDLPQINITNHIQRIQKFHSPLTTNLTSSLVSSATIAPSTIGGFQWYSSPVQEDALRDDDAVSYYVKDVPMSLQELIQSNPPSWGLDRIDQRKGTNDQFRFPTSQGRGVVIYILDTGVSDHEDLENRLTYGPSFVDDDSSGDPNGHGTFVAGVCCGTEYGVAKQANVISVKTLDSEGNGMLSDLLKGLAYVVEQHTAHNNSNLSLGAFYNQAANDAIETAISLGIHVTIAAGNYGEDACKYSPGSTPGAITVGATDPDDSIASYSNFGKCVDIFAPGTDIVSIWNDEDEHTRTGTSMAAPHVTGVMALFLSQSDYTPSKLQQHVKHVSSQIRNDFEIDVMGNGNKTVADNSINDGYRVKGYNGSTLANLLYNHPVDGTATFIFRTASKASTTLTSRHASQPLTLLPLLLVSFIVIIPL